MNTIKIESGNVKLIAHRGLSGLEAENTCSAFVAAANRSYYGIETDIRKTADGNIIINHDEDLMRVSGEEIYVESVSVSVAQNIVHFDIDGKKGRKDLISPTLHDYINICKKYEKYCIIELKSLFTDKELSRIINIVSNYGYLDKVIFISFIYDNLLKIRAVLPKQPLQYLFCDITDETIQMLMKDKIDVDVNFSSLSKERIELFHNAGLKVNCWTVDKKEDAKKLINMGVDFITTNILE